MAGVAGYSQWEIAGGGVAEWTNIGFQILFLQYKMWQPA